MKQSAYWPAAIQKNQNRNLCSHTRNRKDINAFKRSPTYFLISSQFFSTPLSFVDDNRSLSIPPENHVLRVMKKIGQPRSWVLSLRIWLQTELDDT